MSKRPDDSEYVAWIDLETTGNRDDDCIIEVGFVLTDRDLNEVVAVSHVVRPYVYSPLRARMSEAVVDMHMRNGLLAELDLWPFWMKTGPETADDNIAAILREFGKGSHIPLAGSGVSHFDRKYIKRELPKTNDLLGYWHYDIGTMRRFLKWWGIETPGSELRLSKTHRALDDIREHIAETKAIRDTLKRHAEDSWKYWELSR